MNLPHSAYEFIPYALKILKEGGKINYYEILPKDYPLYERFEDERLKIKDVHRVHEYSPAKTLFSFLLLFET